MGPGNLRYEKVRKIALECMKHYNGIYLALNTINKHRFKAPCGRKGNWNIFQIENLIKGKVCEPYSEYISTKVTMSVFNKLKATGNVPEFLRKAILEKFERDNLNGTSLMASMN